MSTLVSKNVLVGARRTSMRLEPAMWDALKLISTREGMTIHQVCSVVEQHRTETSLTSAIRVFILGYFRVLAGHLEGARPGVSIMRQVFRETEEFRNTPRTGSYAGSL